MKVNFNKAQKEFYNETTMAINDYFRENKLSRKANPFMVFKTLYYLSFLLGSYIVLLTINVNASVFFALWMILGLSSVFLVVNCGHDAIHGAFANRKWINTFMRLSYDLLGANSYLWGISHNGIHHTYTSIEEVDGDLVSVPFTRLTPNQNIKSYHRFQHMYVFFLYSFATLYWVFIKDYKKFFQLQSAGSKKSIPKVQYFNLFSYKIIYYSIFLAIPLFIINKPWHYICGGFLISHFIEGITIATIFALAHIVEKANFYKADEDGNIENNWAIHQMYTTVNFGSKSNLTAFLCGGLNFQIEHHLFPSICHVHYPVISKIIKGKALKHGIPYLEYTTFYAALKSHIRLLKRLGRLEGSSGLN